MERMIRYRIYISLLSLLTNTTILGSDEQSSTPMLLRLQIINKIIDSRSFVRSCFDELLGQQTSLGEPKAGC